MYMFIHIGHSRNSIQHKSTGINIAAWISSTILYLFKAVLQCYILSTLKQLMLDPGHLYFENKYFYNIFQFNLIMFGKFIHQNNFNVHLLVFFNPLPRSEEGIIRMHFVRLSVRLFVTYVSLCIDGLPSILVQMLSSMRQCAVTLTRINTSKVKVTQHVWMSEYTCLCPRYNLRMHWWITI